MKSFFELQVIQPAITACHENWETMTEHEKGKFCNSCNKVVHDISKFTRHQFEQFVLQNQGKEICARTQAAFLEKPFSVFTKKEPPRIAWFAVILFIVFGMTLFSCNEKEYEAAKLAVKNAVSYEEMKNSFDEKIAPEVSKPRCGCLDLIIEKEYEVPDIVKLEEITIEQPESNLLDIVIIEDMQPYKYETYGYLTVGALTYYTVVEPISLSDIAVQEIPNIQHFDNALKIYPNPARENITIEYKIAENGFVMLSLFSISGQKVADIVSNNNSSAGKYAEQFDVSALPGGTYIVVLINNEQKKTFQLSVID